MGFLQSIFKARDKPSDYLGSRYAFLLGGTTAGKPVNEQTTMQMMAVYSCVGILSETLAGHPLHVYRYNSGGAKEKSLKHLLYKLLHDQPTFTILGGNPNEQHPGTARKARQSLGHCQGIPGRPARR